jgi:ornithine carbamoyltransferase
MAVRHFLSLAEIGSQELARLVDRSVEFATTFDSCAKSLAGNIVGLYFRGPSTRTRTSFSVAAMKLGARTIAYGPNDLQVVTGETLDDTGRVLSGYLDALIVRTNCTVREMTMLAAQDQMAVVNAMSEEEHPTQAVADLSTIKERFGDLTGRHILYLGEGNNTAAALALAVAKTQGMKITLATPKEFGLPEHSIAKARESAAACGGIVDQQFSADDLPTGVDVVYTTRWQTMGVPHVDPKWRDAFAPFGVTADLMRKVSRSEDTIFMHDLPAVRGEDVTSEVIDGSQSLVWQQARHKMFSAMSILEWCLTASGR